MHITPDTSFNLFRANLGHWTTVKLNHVVEIKDTRIFIKASHVRCCKDLEKFLASTSSSATAPNLRTNLAGERVYVKKKMLEYELSQAPTPSSIKNKHRLSTESYPSTPKRHHALLDEAPTPALARHHAPIPPPKFTRKRVPGVTRVIKRKGSAAAREKEMTECYESDLDLELINPFLLSNHSPQRSASPPIPGAPLPSCQPSSLPSTSQSASTLNPPSPAESTIKQEDPEPTSLPTFRLSGISNSLKKSKWPAEFFAIDIVNCFEDVEENAGDAQVRAVFERHFGQWAPYRRSTFYEHRGRWQAASLAAKQVALAAGRTESGLWSKFMSVAPARRALLKAVRKRKTKQVINEGIIEISSDEGGV